MTTNYRSIAIDGSMIYRFPASTNAQATPAASQQPTASQRYEAEVVACLIAIDARRTGQIILRAVGGAGRTLTIVPTSTDANAGAIPIQGTRATPAGQPVRAGDLGRPVVDGSGRPVLGTGGGSNVGLLFNPRHINPLRLATIPPGARAEEVLLHELVHAYRQMRGTLTNAPGVGRGGTPFGNDDEFLAVVIADIFASERGETALRGSHGTWGVWQGALGAIAGALNDRPVPFRPGATLSMDFASQNHVRLNALKLQDRALFASLATVPAHFNPVRDLDGLAAGGFP